MNKVLKPYGNTCTVELELPWEVAELLVEQGPGLIEDIALALKMRKQRTEQNEKYAALRQSDYEQAKTDFFNLGMKVDQALKAAGDNKKQTLRELAVEYDTNTAFLERVRKLYRDRVTKEEKQTRNTQIIRFYFQGLSNREIGRQVGIAPGSVSRILSEQGDLIAALRKATQDEVFNKGAAK